MSESKAWICTVCGYVHQGENPPEFCPVCGASSAEFQLQASAAPEPSAASVTQWRCMNCNYVHDGAEPPDGCIICGAPEDRFEAVLGRETEGHAEGSLRIVIVGGCIAGVSAAESVRHTAPGSKVVLISQEAALPYYRLNLTRYLAGEIEKDTLPIHDESWYAENGIDLRTGSAVAKISPEEKTIECADGEVLEYDRLILTLGSHAFVPPIEGAEMDGVTSLRTSDDADEIIRRAGDGGKCVVIGGGVLGLETAGSLARQGINVTLLESHDWLMPRQLNRKAAALLEQHMADIGITLKKNAHTRRFAGDGSVNGVELEGGEVVDADVAVLATGVRPNTALARKAGLEVDKGIIVSNKLQTSDDSIYAAGDVAEHNGRLYGAWAPSQYQGKIAGLNACGVDTEFGGMPRSNALKVLGVDLLSIGEFEAPDGSYTVLDHEESGKLAHFVFRDGKMAGAILMGYPELGPQVKHAVEEGSDFSATLMDAKSGADIISQLEKV